MGIRIFLVSACISLVIAVSPVTSRDQGDRPNLTGLDITRAPVVQESYTTILPNDHNITLNTMNDTIFSFWTMSQISPNVKKWFEYYNSTEQLKNDSTDDTKCASVISEFAGQLENVEGIWAACHPMLPPECDDTSSGCYPFIKYSERITQLRTVKINLLVHGFAIVRLTTRHGCFDYALKKDHFSPCEYMGIEKNSVDISWKQVRSGFDGYDDVHFSDFTVQLIARFKGDLALVDKIEATDYLMCEDDDHLCTVTPTGPTATQPTTTTWTPPFSDTSTTSTTTASTTTSTTTTTPTTTITSTTTETEPTTTDTTETETTNETTSPTTTTQKPIIKESILETKEDADIDKLWDIPSLTPKWLEYYVNSESIRDQENDTNYCASIIVPVTNGLKDTEGIWSSCYQPQKDRPEPGMNAYTNDPSISYSFDGHLETLTMRFYLEALAVIRLHVGHECVDYTVSEDPYSPCKFVPIRQDGIYWRGSYWSRSEGLMLSEFKIELLSTSAGDFILLDTIKVSYRSCENGACATTQTTVDPTTELTGSTDCEETSSSSASTSEGPVDPSTTESSNTEAPSTTPECTTTTTRATRRTTPRNKASSSYSSTSFAIILSFFTLLPNTFIILN